MNGDQTVNPVSMEYDTDNYKVKHNLFGFPEYMEKMEQVRAKVSIKPEERMGKISETFIGYNLEDINHSIYPGLYAQMLYGESFEEEPLQRLPKGWNWHAEPVNEDTPKDPDLLLKWRGAFYIEDQVLTMVGCRQRRIYTNEVQFGDGYVECEMYQPSNERSYYGPGILACWNPDSYYYITIVPERGLVSVGKGKDSNFVQSAAVLGSCSAPVQYDTWYRLGASFKNGTITVYLDGNELFTCPDEQLTNTAHGSVMAGHRAGGVGLEASFTVSRFRNLLVIPEGGTAYRADFTMRDRKYSHEENISRWWNPVETGSAEAFFCWEKENPYNTDRCQRIEHRGGEGSVGVYNTGLHNWGLSFKKNHIYTGRVYLRGEYSGCVTAALKNRDGSVLYGEAKLSAVETEWKRFDFSIPCSGDEKDGRFDILIDEEGYICADQAVLLPDSSALYCGLPIRRDTAGLLKESKISHIRFGGDMINTWNFDWKTMLIPQDKRRQYMDGWNYHKSAQFMIFEFLEFMEAMELIPIINLAEHYNPKEIAEFVEYANGGPETVWGAERIRNGREKPYGVKYLMFGNGMPPMERLREAEKLIHETDPDIVLISGDIGHVPWVLLSETDPESAAEFHTFAEKYEVVSSRPEVSLISSHHIWEELIEKAVREFPCLQKGTLLYAEEVNGGTYDWQRGLLNAAFDIVSENHADVIFGQSYCNILQASGHLYEWNQGSIHFNQETAWMQPAGYAVKLAAENLADYVIKCETECVRANMEQRTADANKIVELPVLSASASVSEDGSRLIVKAVSFWGGQTVLRFDMGGFQAKRLDIAVMHSRHLKACNGPGREEISPVYVTGAELSEFRKGDGEIEYILEPCSFTVFTFYRN